MFDSSQPQWEKVLETLRQTIIIRMRDSLEYQACTAGEIEASLLEFCEKYESICMHHENPRYFLNEFKELVLSAFTAFDNDKDVQKELIELMISDEWFDLIRWFDKEYEDFEEE